MELRRDVHNGLDFYHMDMTGESNLKHTDNSKRQ